MRRPEGSGHHASGLTRDYLPGAVRRSLSGSPTCWVSEGGNLPGANRDVNARPSLIRGLTSVVSRSTGELCQRTRQFGSPRRHTGRSNQSRTKPEATKVAPIAIRPITTTVERAMFIARRRDREGTREIAAIAIAPVATSTRLHPRATDSRASGAQLGGAG